MTCEKCWKEAGELSFSGSGWKTKTDYYHELIKTNNCTPREQAGEYWDDEKQIDTRAMAKELDK